MDRRQFLTASLVAGTTALVGCKPGGPAGSNTAESAARPRPPGQPVPGSYGPLTPTASQNTGELLLAIPAGFHYHVLGATGAPMADGHATPACHDGMAAFPVDGKIRLVRNHEEIGAPRGAIDPRCYDPVAHGGCTTLIVDPVSRVLERSFVSLAGTIVNCAGGPTPWGSWISCEECVRDPGPIAQPDGTTSPGFTRKHGYCFEVPATGEGPAAPEPLLAMGRFVHEAVAVDPATGIVYETEDRDTAGFYRFIPRTPARLRDGGALEMLAIDGDPGADLRTDQRPGVVLHCTWVPIADPDPEFNSEQNLAVYQQGLALGGATFARLEGCWAGQGSVFLNATTGGDAGLGQVWRFTPRGQQRGELTLLFESPSPEVLSSPDNLTVSPRGGLVLCEDCRDIQHLRGLSPSGEVFDLVRNVHYDSEFAGVTYSPDGETLFFNIQRPGLTIALWGDWHRGVL